MIKYLSNLFDDPDPVIIHSYGGYANNTHLFAQARVLEDEGIDDTYSSSTLQNIYRSFKRFETDEIANATVKVSWQGGSTTLVSDEEGYVYLNAEHHLTLNHQKALWIPITYELYVGVRLLYTTTSSLLKPATTAEFGVISDLDETVISTGLDTFLKWKVLVNTLATHSDKRLPLEGATTFYNNLFRGKSGYAENPFFYLSNSPWNLYDYLSAFLMKQQLPKGVLLLRDIGLENKKKKSFKERNKYLKISHILTAYPNLSFILIGDAQDIDPDIYLEIARNFSKQIVAIYIRTVNNAKKVAKASAIIEEATDVDIVLVQTTEEAYTHAKTKGFVIHEE